jgi:hypothetical protein
VSRRTRAAFSIAVAAIAAIVAGCGTVAVGPPIPGPPTASVTPGQSVVSGHALRPDGALLSGRSQISGQSASEIMRATVRALDHVRSYVVTARGVDAKGRQLRFTAAVVLSTGTGREYSLAVAVGPVAFTLRELDGYDYLAGTYRYWLEAHVKAPEAQQLANHWLRLPVSKLPSFAAFRDLANPSKAGRCLLGTDLLIPTLAGHSRVGADATVALADDGRRSGTPEKLFVSAAGEPLPLEITQTGPQSNTNPVDPACGNSTPSKNGGPFGNTPTKRMVMSFGDYNQITRILPPAGPFRSTAGGQPE